MDSALHMGQKHLDEFVNTGRERVHARDEDRDRPFTAVMVHETVSRFYVPCSLLQSGGVGLDHMCRANWIEGEAMLSKHRDGSLSWPEERISSPR